MRENCYLGMKIARQKIRFIEKNIIEGDYQNAYDLLFYNGYHYIQSALLNGQHVLLYDLQEYRDRLLKECEEKGIVLDFHSDEFADKVDKWRLENRLSTSPQAQTEYRVLRNAKTYNFIKDPFTPYYCPHIFYTNGLKMNYSHKRENEMSVKKFKCYALEEIPEDIINAKLPDDIVNYTGPKKSGVFPDGYMAYWLAQNRIQALQEGLTSIENIRKLIANFTRPDRSEKIAKEMERRKKGIYG